MSNIASFILNVRFNTYITPNEAMAEIITFETDIILDFSILGSDIVTVSDKFHHHLISIGKMYSDCIKMIENKIILDNMRKYFNQMYVELRKTLNENESYIFEKVIERRTVKSETVKSEYQDLKKQISDLKKELEESETSRKQVSKDNEINFLISKSFEKQVENIKTAYDDIGCTIGIHEMYKRRFYILETYLKNKLVKKEDSILNIDFLYDQYFEFFKDCKENILPFDMFCALVVEEQDDIYKSEELENNSKHWKDLKQKNFIGYTFKE